MFLVATEVGCESVKKTKKNSADETNWEWDRLVYLLNCALEVFVEQSFGMFADVERCRVVAMAVDFDGQMILNLMFDAKLSKEKVEECEVEAEGVVRNCLEN